MFYFIRKHFILFTKLMQCDLVCNEYVADLQNLPKQDTIALPLITAIVYFQAH